MVVLGAGPTGEKAAAQAAYWGKPVEVGPAAGETRQLRPRAVLTATGQRLFRPRCIRLAQPDELDPVTARQHDRPSRSLVVVRGRAVRCESAAVLPAPGAAGALVDS